MADEEQVSAPEAEATEEHIRPEQMFALVWANRDNKDSAKGDEELERLFKDLDERFYKSLAVEHRLGPETAKRLWEHAISGDCNQCRMAILEDGPHSRPPKTKAEIAAEERKTIDERKRKLIKFWVDIPVGTAFFVGAMVVINEIRASEFEEVPDNVLQVDPRDQVKQIDPRWLLFLALVFAASWFLAEAYTLAKSLWIDFTAWKRAVPVIGEWWAGKRPQDKLDDE